MSHNNKLLIVAMACMWFGGFLIGLSIDINSKKTIATIFVDEECNITIAAKENLDSRMVSTTRELSVFEVTNY